MKPTTPKEYIDSLPPDRKKSVAKLRAVIRKNLPKGFVEQINYGMLGYVVPHRLYPDGYHCDPKLPLPFMNLASQKHFVAVYHMGIYADPKLMNWFTTEYGKRISGKLDMGKSCVRFKSVPPDVLTLIGELSSRVTPAQWIRLYEKSRH